MKIMLQNIGKRFNDEWIFKNLNYDFETGNNYAILGANGSGKSTLLQVLAGSSIPSVGKLVYSNGKAIEDENIFRHISFCAPYLELIEEFTFPEIIRFQSKMKKFQKTISEKEILKIAFLDDSANKQIKYFSSGMKQRAKLALSVLSDTPVLLLDEPTSNLDSNGVEWYKSLICDYSSDKLIIVCSNNQKDEFSFCNKEIRVEDYKR